MFVGMKRRSIEWCGSTFSLETGKLARNADGAVDACYGGTRVLSTVSIGAERSDVDFVPLTVQFVTKAYATGKIPGGFIKREGKASDRDTLISRLIDRSIRPLLPEGLNRDVVIICNLLAYDSIHSPEAVALAGVSAALGISSIPFAGPVAGVKVGLLPETGELIANGSQKVMATSNLDLFLSCSKDSVLMLESEASELSEKQMLDAMIFGHANCQPVIDLIEDFIADSGEHKISFMPIDVANIVAEMKDGYGSAFIKAYSIHVKKERSAELLLLRESIVAEFLSKGYDEKLVNCAIKQLERSIVRERMVSSKTRIDGRAFDQVREIEGEVNLLTTAHGSALFTRGSTQALVAAVLGTSQDEQIVDDLDGDRREHFMLHYNFPSYATGEAAALRPPGRREIGHGKLAARAISRVLPTKEEFPYTIRIVSEITESDGSSSMATVCGSSMALMDTGVPIKSAVSGIAMGLIKEGDKVIVLSDILGDEDHLGDMDFKVAGTANGVTALQMDMKILGITFDIIEKSLEQARLGRLHIMEKMNAVISKPCISVKQHAPRRESFSIDKDKIRNVIGSGGKNIRDICEKTGAKIDIEQDGTVLVYAATSEAVDQARILIINSITEPEVGCVYDGVIEDIKGSFVIVNFLAGRKGAVHISEIKNEHIESMEKVVAKNDKVKVLVIGIDHHRIKLSMRRVNQETGEIQEGSLYEEDDEDSGFSSNNDNFGNSSDSSTVGRNTASRRRVVNTRSSSSATIRPPHHRRRTSVSGGGNFDSEEEVNGNRVDAPLKRPEEVKKRFF